MSSILIREQANRFLKSVPDILPGYTVRVHEKIQEGGKERVQIFEGLVISVHKGHVPTDRSFTVRKIVSGVGVEKVFPLHSPVIEKIEVKKIAKVRRAKLFFLRGSTGKAARLNERFTTDDEFSIAVAAPAMEEKQEDIVTETVQAEEVVAETPTAAAEEPAAA